MSTTTRREHDPGRERQALRGAVLREAGHLVGARDVLVVDAAELDRVRLVEALVCGEHWEAAAPLDLAREPLLLRAVTSDRVLRCCPRRPRRLLGPFWATGATFVPLHTPAGTMIVVFAGGGVQPADGPARDAAAMAAALRPATDGSDGAPPARQYAVLVARAGWLSASPSTLDRIRERLDGPAPDGTQVLHLQGPELCVVVPAADPLVCERVVGLVRGALRDGGGEAVPPPTVGWAIGSSGEPPARAVEVARAMARHEERLQREEER